MANYCTIDDVKRLLPKAMTIGENTLAGQDVIQQQGKAHDITTETVSRYINFASQYIDSRLRTIYSMPLRRIKTVEQDLPQELRSGSDIVITSDGGAFTQGSLVRIGDDSGSDLYSVKAVYDDPVNINQIKLERKSERGYPMSANPRISLVEYPDPIPLMCARYAVSNIIDKIFVADQAPNETSFGKLQRTLASTDMDDLIMGIIKLQGQDHTGYRFSRLSMRDSWASPAHEPQPGRGKEN
ncbi:MAG: hypothetical protein M0R32_10610 [Candidatus Cloacimonetes bacterium]|jgi:hypothetical protein|nr:hypothetical protein [Candidatus Cloacimonadota bacterium]